MKTKMKTLQSERENGPFSTAPLNQQESSSKSGRDQEFITARVCVCLWLSVWIVRCVVWVCLWFVWLWFCVCGCVVCVCLWWSFSYHAKVPAVTGVFNHQ